MILRHNRSGVGETYQALMAITVVIVCVALVLGAVHAASSEAARRAAVGRAQLQADIALDAITEDSVLLGSSGNLNWSRAGAVAAHASNISFLPSSVAIVTLRQASGGEELFLVGNKAALSPDLLFASRPVAIDSPSGLTVPGVLRVGIEVDA